MKLIISKTSPFARKCRILIREKGLKVEEIESKPFDDEPALLDNNPLGQVPVLVLDNGRAIIDSAVICEHLDAAKSPWLKQNIWQQKSLHAFADGMIEAVLVFRMERIRPPELWWDFVAMRKENAIGRAIIYLENMAGELADDWDFANLAIACALGYLDFRAPDVCWREHAPNLAKWFEKFEASTSYKNTAPPQ